MNVFWLLSITLVITNLIFIVIKGKDFFNKYLFFLFFTFGFIAFSADYYDIYKNIPNDKVFMIFINIVFYYVLLLAVFLFDKIFKGKTTKTTIQSTNIGIVRITKILVVINLLITLYSLHRLMSITGLSLFNLYLQKPYFLEVNFSPNAILGNILKLNLYNFVLIIALKLQGIKYKHFKLYFVLSLAILMAPNRKGELIILSLAIMHLLLYFKSINIKSIIKIFSILIATVYSVFSISYFFYRAAGVRLSTFEKFYMYLTGPIANTGYLQKSFNNNLFELRTLRALLDKLNVLELHGLKATIDPTIIGGVNTGNVKGFFEPYYFDFGIAGVIIFALLIGLMINLLDIKARSVFSRSLLVILLAFLDLALFGNYFTNQTFIMVLVSFILFKICYSFIKIIVKRQTQM